MSNIPVNPGVNMSTLKSRILNPALTSFYSVDIVPPSNLLTQINSELGLDYDKELFELTCIEASLPGSQLATIDIDNDYMGVSQKNIYRRMYDNSIDLTFLVTKDSNYQQIRFFEMWMKYASGEDIIGRMDGPDFYTRIRYPTDYKSEIRIAKYERDLGSKTNSGTKEFLGYYFVDAFPLSISSMPISYDASDTLKSTVSISYSRYYIKREVYSTELSQPQTDRPPTPGAPGVGGEEQSNSWRYSQQQLEDSRVQARENSLRQAALNRDNATSPRRSVRNF
jgi:hypothetical protein